MRECWVNIYRGRSGFVWAGCKHPTRLRAQRISTLAAEDGAKTIYRIHIRPKR